MELTSLTAGFTQLSARISRNGDEQASTVARLSSGERIIRAGDDVAGLSVSTRMLTRTTALRSVMTNLSQATSALQVMEGGMVEVQGLMERMSALSVMAGSGGISNQERAFLDIEFQELGEEIDRLSSETNFNGVNLLNGSGVNLRTDSFVANGNIVQGTDDVERFDGSSANETFLLGGGNDIVYAGAGNDSVDAGTGRDNVYLGDGDDRVTIDLTVPIEEANTVPVQDNLAIQIDASNTASIGGHPGNVTTIQDQGAFNSDAFADVGNVITGQDNMNQLNTLTFDGTGSLRFNDSANLNLGNVNERTIMISFETGSDVSSRQVLYEQGGTVNGYNLYIDGGQLYIGAWKGTGGNFDYHIGTAIEANTSYAAGLVFDFPNGELRGYLDGSEFANAVVTQNQNAHSGDIGLGGMNQDSRFYDGSIGGDGFRFQGEIGEFVNYRDALTTSEAQAVQDYLVSKWVTGVGSDVVDGGNGIDTITYKNDALSLRLDGGGAVTGVENIILNRDVDSQSISVTDDYFAAGTGVQTEALVIDATLSDNGFSFSGSTLSGSNTVIVKESIANDTINGNGSGNVVVSYEGSGGVTINLLQETAIARGTDTLNEVNAVIGSEFGDHIFGSTSSDTLSGGGGADVIGDFTSTAGELITNNLVHYSDFGNTGSLTGYPGDITGANDQSSANNDVINDSGTSTSDSTTEINGLAAVKFGLNANLSIGNTADINTVGQAQRSIFMTIETGNDVNSRQMVFEEGGSGNGYSIYIEGGRAFVNMWQGGAGGLFLQQSVDIDPNEAFSIGFVFDSSGEGDFTGYINGVAFGSEANTVAQLAHGGRIGIGGVADNTLFLDAATDAGSFEGAVGELLIYNSALSDDELNSLSGFLNSRRVNNIGGADVMNGGAGNDSITGGGGNDIIDGGDGDDKAYYTGSQSNYKIEKLDDGSYRVTDTRVTRNDGADIVRNVETLVFEDGQLAISDLDDSTKLIYRSGDESGNYIRVELPNLSSENLFRGEALSISSVDGSRNAFNVIADAMDYLTSERARVGARLASVDILIDNTNNALLAQDAARAVVADADYAVTSTDYANQMVQGQMSIAISAQANQLREDVVLNIINDTADVSSAVSG